MGAKKGKHQYFQESPVFWSECKLMASKTTESDFVFLNMLKTTALERAPLM